MSAFWRYGGWRTEAPIAGAPALAARDAAVRYPGSRQLALRGVSVTVAPGTRVALVGPNGSGKSTLLKATAGLLPLVSGSITVFGRPVGATSQWVAYLPQRGEVDWRFPIDVETLVLAGRYGPLGWLRRPGPADRRLARQAMQRLGIDDLSHRQVGELSGGQQQRAMLARALAQGADLLLLDEPLNAVDPATRQVFADVLDDLTRAGKTAIVATHDVGRLASDFDGVLYLSDGEEVPAPSAVELRQVAAWGPAWAS